jgi:hypothetical protein
MKGSESFFKRKFGDVRGEALALSPEAIYSPPLIDTQIDLEQLRTEAISEMAGENGATSEEIREGLNYLKAHPEFAESIRSDFEGALHRAEKLSPEAARAAIENELRVLSSEAPDSAEIERLQKNGILVPLIMTRQARAAEVTEADIKAAARDKVGKMRTSKRGKRIALGLSAAGITGGAAYLDVTFSKAGLSNIVDVLTDKVGAEWMMEALGRGLMKVTGSPIPSSLIEQASYGKGAVTMVLVGTALGYLGYQKWTSEKFSDLFHFKKHPVRSSANAGLVMMFLLLGSGGVTTKTTESGRARQLAQDIALKYKPTESKLSGAVTSAENLKKDVDPLISSKVDIAFKTGSPKVGPLTASTWLALNGDIPDQNGKRIAERYEGKDKQKMEQIKGAVVKVNQHPEYAAIGMKPEDGAKQLLEYLTNPLPPEASGLSEHFKSMLEIAHEKASVTIWGAVLGDLNPVDAAFWRSAVTMEKLFQMQEQYPQKYIELIHKVAGLQILTKYLAEVEGQINADAKVKVDLKINLLLPNLGFTEGEIAALTIKRDEYKDVLDPSKTDAIANLFWGTEAAWKSREEIIGRDIVANDLGDTNGGTKVLLERLAYQSTIWGAFLAMVVGSVWVSGSLRKRLNRMRETDMDAYTEKLNEKEDALVTSLIAFAQASSAEAIATLHRNGIDHSANDLMNEAFRAAVSVALRTSVLASITDPRSGKPLAESPDAQNFVDRAQGRHFEGEERKKILAEYEKKLSAWQNSLAKDPFGTMAELMTHVDPSFDAIIHAIVAANSANPGTKERALAVESLRERFNAREKGLMSMEAQRAAAHIARLEARRDAVREMVGEDDDVELVLSPDMPALTQKEVVASYILADIDSEIHAWQRDVEALKSKGASVQEEAVQLTDAEWESERSAFLSREMNRIGAGSEMAAEGDVTLEKLNAFVRSLGAGIAPIQRELETQLRASNPNASLAFMYGYHPLREGPTVSVLLSDAQSGTTTRIPFRYKIPSEEGMETQKVLSDIREWARPEGVLSQRLRISAIFEKTRTDYLAQQDALLAFSSAGQFEVDSVRANAARFDEFMRTAGIMQEQRALLERLIGGEKLDANQLRVFTEPSTAIRDLWRGSVAAAIERSRQRKFVNIPGKRLVIAFDQQDKGYILAVPQGAALPVSLESTPESDKILIKRASVA